ncbi:hypothetical protein Pan258_02250 [Symmachiella dynata]|uniref:restriction endonuclease n=1 Tax=Symmachiella dynata TaxID=2527995 RepID=UPI00118D271F|nr:restriction endonuclease [Symmachiella dynata]QDT46208.1 hypothetical protein Pan258_02250 [Symmachiella dynata]
MKWQEYQDAVAVLYEQMGGIGNVERNVRIPDCDTGQPRQIDVLLTIKSHNHELRIVIDAKQRQEKLDVKDVEEVAALAKSVKACKAVIVAANGWSGPAEIKANAIAMDLRILTIEDALDLVVRDKWEMCTNCQEDCIVLDQDGAVELNGAYLWWLAGQCRNCGHGFFWCQECGTHLSIGPNENISCECGYTWVSSSSGIELHINEGDPPSK